MATQTGSIDLRGVKQSYEGVSVGGRNLFLLSDFSANNPYWTQTSGTTPTVDGEKVTITQAGEFYQKYSGDGSIPTSATIPSGTTLTLSCYFYENTANGNRRIYYAQSPSWMFVTVPTNFVGLWSTTFTTSVDITKLCIDYDCRGLTSGTWVCSPCKLERGTKPTAWTPAPEDVASDISTAQTTANNAAGVVEAVSTIANSAQQTATDAQHNISNIETIVGASTWATVHGFYKKSTDTSVDTSKEYYTISATAITNPTGCPHRGLYYEKSNNVYTLSTDDIVVSGKTYYTISATLVASPSGSPSSNDYYERDLNESIEDYLTSHIRTDANGLYVTDGSTSKVQVSSTGVSIWSDGEEVANYGSVARIGNESGFHILIGGPDNEIGFYEGANNKAAYVSGDSLYVKNSLSFGKKSDEHKSFIFYQRENGHFTLKLV